MSLELFLGPMFAGKSSAVLSVIRRNAVIGRTTFCITSSLDDRYSEQGEIASHDRQTYPAYAVTQLLPLLNSDSYTTARCLIIEEAQFFPDLHAFVLTAVERDKKDVICVGLDGDSSRRPFGQLLDLIPYADHVQKFYALCRSCGDGTRAIFTHRRAGVPTTQISVGGAAEYEPLCRKHFLEANTVASPCVS